MLKNLTNIAFLLAVFVAMCIAPNSLSAQLTDEMRNMFEQIVDELDDDLQKKFRKAMKENRNVIQFTPDEFRRFRDNPINPFDGIQDIDAGDLDGNVELKFELPSLRNRTLERFERQQHSTLRTLDAVISNQAMSVVEVWNEGKQVALGSVVDRNGLILTKASELGDKKEIQVVLHNGTRLSASLLRSDKQNDLAVLKVQRNDLTPISFENEQPLSGAFVVTAGRSGKSIAVGTYSGVPRSLASTKQGFLGVKPQTAPGGVRLVQVTSGDAGALAGLKDGDLVTTIAGNRMTDVTDLVNEIRTHHPGDSVEIEFIRNGAKKRTTAVLADRNFSGKRAARFKMMNRLGAIPSERASGFPWVFQHDTPLFPEECGGPIFDLSGNVIGINIARGGRAASYAIPSSHILKILPDLLKASVASRN